MVSSHGLKLVPRPRAARQCSRPPSAARHPHPGPRRGGAQRPRSGACQRLLLTPTRKSGHLCFGALRPPKQRTPGANGTNLDTPGHARVRSTTYVTPRQLFGKKTSKPPHDRDRFSRSRAAVSNRWRSAMQFEGPLWTLCPRCLTTQGAATRPTALAPAPQHPGRPHVWRNGWRNG